MKPACVFHWTYNIYTKRCCIPHLSNNLLQACTVGLQISKMIIVRTGYFLWTSHSLIRKYIWFKCMVTTLFICIISIYFNDCSIGLRICYKSSFYWNQYNYIVYCTILFKSWTITITQKVAELPFRGPCT